MEVLRSKFFDSIDIKNVTQNNQLLEYSITTSYHNTNAQLYDSSQQGNSIAADNNLLGCGK